MNERRRRQDAMYAKLALSAHPAPQTDACPSPEDLAAFSQGLLSGERQEAVLRHLSCCEACHEELVEISALLAEGPDPTPERVPLAVVEALHKGAVWLGELKKRIVPGTPIPEAEAATLAEKLMAVLLPGLPQPAEVMAQEAGPGLVQCPWCGSVGAAPQDADSDQEGRSQTWFRCDVCGGAFRA